MPRPTLGALLLVCAISVGCSSDLDEPAITAETFEAFNTAYPSPTPVTDSAIRELDPMTGGWGYFHSIPFGAQAPGENAEGDALWDACREGDALSCDTLYEASSGERDYAEFASTCGGRTARQSCSEFMESSSYTSRVGYRFFDPAGTKTRLGDFDLNVLPGPASEPPPPQPFQTAEVAAEFDQLWRECGQEGRFHACLALRSDRATRQQQAFGQSCGGRIQGNTHADCIAVLTDSQDRPSSGDSPPGSLGTEADDLWQRCSANRRSCVGAFLELHDIDPDRSEVGWPYWVFLTSCGGVYDQPLSMSCDRGEFSSWPVVSHVDDLPYPPKVSVNRGERLPGDDADQPAPDAVLDAALIRSTLDNLESDPVVRATPQTRECSGAVLEVGQLETVAAEELRMEWPDQTSTIAILAFAQPTEARAATRHILDWVEVCYGDQTGREFVRGAGEVNLGGDWSKDNFAHFIDPVGARTRTSYTTIAVGRFAIYTVKQGSGWSPVTEWLQQAGTAISRNAGN